MHSLKPENIETGEPEIDMISDKHQYNDKSTLNNTISGLK